jgi:hypothetical protein
MWISLVFLKKGQFSFFEKRSSDFFQKKRRKPNRTETTRHCRGNGRHRVLPVFNKSVKELGEFFICMSLVLNSPAVPVVSESRFEAAIGVSRVADAVFIHLTPGTSATLLLDRDVRALHATVPRPDTLSQTVENGLFSTPTGLMPGLTELPIWQQWSSGGRKRILKDTRDTLILPGVAALELCATDTQLYWHGVLEVLTMHRAANFVAGHYI